MNKSPTGKPRTAAVKRTIPGGTAVPGRAPGVAPLGLNVGRNGVGWGCADRGSPVRCMRVSFWGVQGSVPVAAAGRGMLEYQRQAVEYAVRRLAAVGADAGTGAKLRELVAGRADDKALHAVMAAIGTPPLPVYGGETTCVAVETDEGNVILFDGGTGVRGCAADLDVRWANRERRLVHLFGTHEHLDHRNGLPFSRLCFASRPFEVKVYGTRRFLEALDDRYGMFTHRLSETVYFDDPVDYRMMSSTFSATELRIAGAGNLPVPWATQPVGAPVYVGATRVDSFEVYHGATRCLAYKVTHRDRVFVFSTDHELRREGADGGDGGRGVTSNGTAAEDQARSEAAEAALRAACTGADLAYFDGQYRLPEYLGKRGIGSGAAVSRVDWGHGCIEDGVERAAVCGVRMTYLGHHDPERTWAERAQIDRELAAASVPGEREIRLANDEEVVDL